MNHHAPLLLCAAAIGLAQVVDCGLLLPNRTMQGGTATAFSVAEWIWGGLCVYWLVQGVDGFPDWLAGAFVSYLVVSTANTAFQIWRGRPPEASELSRAEVLAAGIFGALYAVGAISLILNAA